MEMRFLVRLTLCVIFLGLVSCSDALPGHKVWRFESKPVRNSENDMSDQNYLDVEVKKPGIPFKSLSFCLRIAPKDLFSHCVFYEDDIKFIFIDESKYYGFLYFQGIYHIFKMKSKITIIPEQWYHVCVSYDQQDEMRAHIKMYFDGIPLIDKPIQSNNRSSPFILSPIWKLGYCRSSLLDPTVETTRGRIRDFSVWSRALSDAEMIRFTRDCSIDSIKDDINPDVLEWNTMQVNQSGSDVKLEYLSFKRKEKLIFSASCVTNTKLTDTKPIKTNKQSKKSISAVCEDDFINVQFKKKMAFEDAALTCQQLGGNMPLPEGYEDFDELIPVIPPTELVNNTNTTVEPDVCQTYWLPIYQGNKYEKGDDEYRWNHYRFDKKGGELVNFLPWELGQPNGLEFQQCVVMGTNTRLYYDVDCKETHCFLCSVCKQLHFYLRGLSKKFSKEEDNRNGIDSRYIYIPKEQQSKTIHLEGYYDHQISANADTGRWEIIRADSGALGTLSTDFSYPFGKHVWNLNSSKISGNQETKAKEELKLSLVSICSIFFYQIKGFVIPLFPSPFYSLAVVLSTDIVISFNFIQCFCIDLVFVSLCNISYKKTKYKYLQFPLFLYSFMHRPERV